MRLSHLCEILRDRHDRFKDIDDLTNSLGCGEHLLTLVPPGHHDRPVCLKEMAKGLVRLYGITRSLDHLDRALLLVEEALAVMPAHHLDRPDTLHTLGVCFASRHQHTRSMEDLQRAVSIVTEANNAVSPDYVHRMDNRNFFATLLWWRYETTMAVTDLHSAIQISEELVASVPPENRRTGPFFYLLAVEYDSLYERNKRLEDLEMAIYWATRAVQATSRDHPDIATYLDTLSLSFSQKFAHSGSVEDLEAAVSNATAAVASIVGHTEVTDVMSLINLSHALCCRGEKLDQIQDFRTAIDWSEKALTALPLEHQFRVEAFNIMGRSLVKIYDRTRQETDKDQALKSFLNAWECSCAPPLDRIKAAQQAVEILLTRSAWEQSSMLLDAVIRLFPAVSPRFLDRRDQQFVLGSLSGLVADACAVTLKAGKGAYQALRLLELGRGVILGLEIDNRADITNLESDHPGLCEELEQCRDDLNQPAMHCMVKSSLFDDQTVSRRIQVASRLDTVLTEIRKQQGYETFQLPPTAMELMSVAREGPIVVINTTDIQSNAIILIQDSMEALDLTDLSAEVASRQLQKMARMGVGAGPQYRANTRDISHVLAWLWHAVVAPVPQKVGTVYQMERLELPRIWWLGVGLMGLFPFHAAHDASCGLQDSTMNRVISSYTPTIKTLFHSRRKKFKLFEDSDARLLLVTMTQTPGRRRDLTAAKLEAENVRRAVGQTCVVSERPQPRITEVLRDLGDFDVIHCACHGVSDPQDPLNSCLELLSENGRDLGRLTVQDVFDSSTDRSQLAFLSACSTAQNRVANLSDEVLHIASGFQVAGFSHVIGTMWNSDDKCCAFVAEEFYRLLVEGRDGGQGHRLVAVALHQAVLALRNKYPRRPLDWAPYIHLGA
jgi:tetratricopeptide (TPR) repeat protein